MRLITERLVIRNLAVTDAPEFAAFRSDPDVARFQSWDTPLSLADAEITLAKYATYDPAAPGWYQYGIDLDGKLIGDIGVCTDENLMQAEIGFTLAAQHQGKGYATEAVGRMVRHLFEDRRLHKISAGCDPRNVSSARLLKRLGFQQEGHLRSHFWGKGEWSDELLFGLLASDYATASATVE